MRSVNFSPIVENYAMQKNLKKVEKTTCIFREIILYWN